MVHCTGGIRLFIRTQTWRHPCYVNFDYVLCCTCCSITTTLDLASSGPLPTQGSLLSHSLFQAPVPYVSLPSCSGEVLRSSFKVQPREQQGHVTVCFPTRDEPLLSAWARGGAGLFSDCCCLWRKNIQFSICLLDENSQTGLSIFKLQNIPGNFIFSRHLISRTLTSDKVKWALPSVWMEQWCTLGNVCV